MMSDKTSDKTRGSIEMSAAMAVSGTIGWFVLTSGQAAEVVVFWRCLFGAATLLAICVAMGLFRHLNRRVLLLAALGGAAIVVNWLLLFAAYPRASISIATAVYNTQPFMLVGLGRLFLGERPAAGKLAWMALAFAGVMAIVEAGPDLGEPGANYLGGIGLALGAAFFYALAALIAKKLTGTPPHLIALVQVCVGLVLTAPFAHLAHLPEGWTAWSCLAAIGVVHTGLVYILLYGAIQRLPTSLSGALSFIYPAVAILVDVVALGHRLQAGQIVGMAMVLVAAAGVPWGGRRFASVFPAGPDPDQGGSPETGIASHPMTALFHTAALAEHQLAMALPLVQITWPELDLQTWIDFARNIREEGGGMLVLTEPDDYICGVVAYRRQAGIDGAVLSVPLFTVADLANRPHLVQALADAVEEVGKQLGCRVGHMEFNWRQSRLIDRLRRMGWPAESALLERRWG